VDVEVEEEERQPNCGDGEYGTPAEQILLFDPTQAVQHHHEDESNARDERKTLVNSPKQQGNNENEANDVENIENPCIKLPKQSIGAQINDEIVTINENTAGASCITLPKQDIETEVSDGYVAQSDGTEACCINLSTQIKEIEVKVKTRANDDTENSFIKLQKQNIETGVKAKTRMNDSTCIRLPKQNIGTKVTNENVHDTTQTSCITFPKQINKTKVKDVTCEEIDGTETCCKLPTQNDQRGDERTRKLDNKITNKEDIIDDQDLAKTSDGTKQNEDNLQNRTREDDVTVNKSPLVKNPLKSVTKRKRKADNGSICTKKEPWKQDGEPEHKMAKKYKLRTGPERKDSIAQRREIDCTVWRAVDPTEENDNTKDIQEKVGNDEAKCNVSGKNTDQNKKGRSGDCTTKSDEKVIETEKFVCERCGKLFKKKRYLLAHQEKTICIHECKECGKTFSSQHQYTLHKRIHNNVRPYLCDVCGKRFIQASHLQAHQRTHTNERPFICEVCGKSFVQSSGLKTHLRSHSQERPYECTVCGKTFTQSGNLKMHVRTHTAEKPYACDQCDKSFAISSNLTQHIKSKHTEERSFSCDVCGRAFHRRSNMVAHQQTHLGEKKFQCGICEKNFSRMDSLKRHLKKHSDAELSKCQNIIYFEIKTDES